MRAEGFKRLTAAELTEIMGTDVYPEDLRRPMDRLPPPGDANVAALVSAMEKPLTLKQLTLAYCAEILRRSEGNKTAAARTLGISRRSMIRIAREGTAPRPITRGRR